VIEPFAGSMAYTLHWKPRYALGIEIDTEIVKLWHRLRAMDRVQLARFRIPEVGQVTTDRWVMLSDQSAGAASNNYRTMSSYMVERMETQRRMVIKHRAYANQSILYTHGDYRDAPDIEACWFVDPPYEGVNGYRHSAIDYEALGEWCMSRRGQVIVCEGANADWLPFDDHSTWQGLPMLGNSNTTVVEKVYVREN
jgi:hypothetical protein